MKGLLAFDKFNDIQFMGFDDDFKDFVLKHAMKEGLLERMAQVPSVIDENILVQMFSPIVSSQRVFIEDLNNPFASVTCQNGFLFVFKQFGDQIHMAINGDRQETEEYLNKKLCVFQRLVGFLYGPVIDGIRAESSKLRQRTWAKLYELVLTWEELYSREQAFLMEATERLNVNQTVNGVCLELLQSVSERLLSAGERHIQHSLLLVNSKLLSLYSRHSAPELQPTDLLTIILLVQQHLPSNEITDDKSCNREQTLKANTDKGPSSADKSSENSTDTSSVSLHRSDSTTSSDAASLDCVSVIDEVFGNATDTSSVSLHRSDSTVMRPLLILSDMGTSDATLRPDDVAEIRSSRQSFVDDEDSEVEYYSPRASPVPRRSAHLSHSTGDGLFIPNKRLSAEVRLATSLSRLLTNKRSAVSDKITTDAKTTDTDTVTDIEQALIHPETKMAKNPVDIHGNDITINNTENKNQIKSDTQTENESVRETVHNSASDGEITADEQSKMAASQNKIADTATKIGDSQNKMADRDADNDKMAASNSSSGSGSGKPTSPREHYLRFNVFLYTTMSQYTPHLLYCVPVFPGIVLLIITQMAQAKISGMICKTLSMIRDIKNGGISTSRLLRQHGGSLFDVLDNKMDKLGGVFRRSNMSEDVDKILAEIRKRWVDTKNQQLLAYLEGGAKGLPTPRLESLLTTLSNKINSLFRILYLCQYQTPRPVYRTIIVSKQAIRQDLQDFREYLMVKARRNIAMTNYIADYPGLVHFIYVDRMSNLITAPSLEHSSDVGKNPAAWLTREIWEQASWMLSKVSDGIMTISVKKGDLQFSFFVWFEDNSGRSVEPEKTTSSEMGLPANVMTRNFYTQLVQRWFPSSVPGEIHCYQLFTVHIGVVPPPFIIQQSRQLSTALWETSAEAFTPISLL